MVEKKTAVKKTAAKKPKVTAAQSAAATKIKVLFAASECNPFAATGGLGDVIGSLPAALNGSEKCEVRVILPLYESMAKVYREQLTYVCHINVPVAWRSQYCGLLSLNRDGVVYYFVDNEYYFKRANLYGYYDDGERFAFFSRAVLELLPYLDFKPDIIHSHDWQTALVPIYYKLFYLYREDCGGKRMVFSVHNIEYQGVYSANILEDVLGIPNYEFPSLAYGGNINLMKGALDYCDQIVTVSPTYAQQLTDSYYAHGLEGVIVKNRHKIAGILNGIDTALYDPATADSLFANYDVRNLEGKAECKRKLQFMLSLPVSPDVPLIAVISRLVAHKGLDLVRYAMGELLKKDVQLVILGQGDPYYEQYFSHIQELSPGKVCTIIAYNKDLAQKLYAAADIFLMPSRAEPCGLGQMIACRYGAVPVVRATGGLKDSIADCGDGDRGNGFVFEGYDVNEMNRAVSRAVGLYRDYREIFESVRKRAMESDFSWKASAVEYVKIYEKVFNS